MDKLLVQKNEAKDAELKADEKALEAKKIFNDSMGLLIKVSSYMREKTSKL